ncbi:MAG TPA: VIT1/CCC1 transporter family protein [Rectinemataceae bacterium]|nr:VIT1/CCC1 transporter family protein [Rectinemataceae bacterium]
MNRTEIARAKAHLKEEREAAFLYGRLSAAEPNEGIASIYARLAETEARHAAFWEQKLGEAGIKPGAFRPSLKARLSARMGDRFGPASVISALAATEREAAGTYQAEPGAESLVADERSHARVFSLMAKATGGMAGGEVARFEGRHRSGGNALRAGTLGANDGLLSVYSLVMGVAGAGVGKDQILLTGIAGLLAGALSMALGEWISVQSSRELYEHQVEIEREELSDNPEEEAEELALIYMAKGLDPEQARRTAGSIIDKGGEAALDTLVREELAIDRSELGGSAWEAAFTSFGLFALGAAIPVAPFLFFSGAAGIAGSSLASALGLFGIGALTTLMTGKNPVIQGLRQVAIGIAAAACTYGVGRLVGVAIAG